MRRTLLALGWMLLAPTTATAGEMTMAPAWIDLARDDLRDDRRALTEIAMDLQGDELVTFRGVYADYEAAAAEIGDRKVDQIMKFSKAWPDISEDLATELATENLSIQKDMLALRKKTYKAVKKELGANAGARFLQIEEQLSMLIELQIASQMPLIHTLDKPTTPQPEEFGKPTTPQPEPAPAPAPAPAPTP